MTYITVHRDGRLVACVHATSEGLVRLKDPIKKGEQVTLTTLRAPQVHHE